MPRQPKDDPPAAGEELRDRMRNCQDTMLPLIRKGYGDERNRLRLDHLREQARAYEREDPKMWAEVSAEKRVKKSGVPLQGSSASVDD